MGRGSGRKGGGKKRERKGNEGRVVEKEVLTLVPFLLPLQLAVALVVVSACMGAVEVRWHIFGAVNGGNVERGWWW